MSTQMDEGVENDHVPPLSVCAKNTDTDLPAPVPENSTITIVTEATSVGPDFDTRRETQALPWPSC